MNEPWLPTPEERASSIRKILDLWPAERRPVRRTLPLSVLFFGVEDCLFLSVLLAGLGLIPAVASARNAPPAALPPLLFLTSPALYALSHLLTLWKDAMSGTLEWKRTCRVPLRRLLALRMLVFGGGAAAADLPAAVACWAVSGRQISLPWLLGLSFSSLFLYAALSLSLTHRGAVLIPPVLWAVLGLVPLRWEAAGALLLQVPALVFFLLAGGSLLFVLGSLWKMLDEPKGATLYAVR